MSTPSGPRRLALSVYLPDKDGTPVLHPAGSTPPSKVAKLITNPSAWEDPTAAGDAPAAAPAVVERSAPQPGTEPAPGQATGKDLEVPAGNASTEAWKAYAEQLGQQVPDDAGREDIKAQLVELNLLEPQQ